MKNNILLFIVCYVTSIHTQSIFTHDTIVQAKDGTFIELSTDFSAEHVNVQYMPQHVINIRDQAKKLPVTAYPMANKTSYLKCITPQQNTEAVELLIRKETLGKKMQQLICKHEQDTMSAHNKVIRFYRKVDSTTDTDVHWIPILTLSEQDASSILADITVHPDGTLHL